MNILKVFLRKKVRPPHFNKSVHQLSHQRKDQNLRQAFAEAIVPTPERTECVTRGVFGDAFDDTVCLVRSSPGII